mgnify:CR=1 FL=1
MYLVAFLLVVIVHVRTIRFLEKIILRSANLMDLILLCGRIKCVMYWFKGQTRQLGVKAKTSDDMDDDDWKELDALIMSTIRLHLANSVYSLF